MSTPGQFYDPFYNVEPKLPRSHFGDDEDSVTEPVTAAYSNELLIEGQGTIAVQLSANEALAFSVGTEDNSYTLHLNIGRNEIQLFFQAAGSGLQIPIDFVNNKARDAGFLNSGDQTVYWLSIDSNNGILRYGKYFYNMTMVIIEAKLKRKEKQGGSDVWVWIDDVYSFIEKLKPLTVTDDGSEANKTSIVVHPLPVVFDLPPFVLSADQITLLDIEKGLHTAPANLPAACQTLYGNVAGAKIVLNDDDFPDFTSAIQRSCITPGCWAYNTLQEKADEFSGKDETYLRITLGYNLGDSPGIPYVLEIWPSGHYSPIHDHGNACAVIKVLHGEISCSWFDNLGTSSRKPALINKGKLKEGQLTWIGLNNYQIHQLHNEAQYPEDVCCTIQCYRYESEDNVHYDAFNWRNDTTGKVEPWEPTSDMAFTDFRNLMKKEWENRDLQQAQLSNGSPRLRK